MLSTCKGVLRHPRLHLVLTWAWIVLIIPSLLFWRNSVPWLIVISMYANIVGHWGSYEAVKAKLAAEEKPTEKVMPRKL